MIVTRVARMSLESLARTPGPVSNAPPLSPAEVAAAALRRSVAIRIVAVSSLLCVALAPIRAKTAGFWLIKAFLDWSNELPRALATSVYDVLFVLGFTGIALGVLWLPAKVPERRARRVYRAHVGMAIFTLAAAMANIPIVAWLGQPFTFQWLMYSDFLRSAEAMLAIAAAVPWWQALGGLFVLACFGCGLVWFARWVESLLRDRRGVRRFFIGALVLVIAYAIGAHLWVTRIGWGGNVMANPIWAFVKSCALAIRVPGPFTMRTPFGTDDFHPPPPVSAGSAKSILPVERAATKNVIYFVLESVASRYVGVYGDKHGVTPELDRRRADAALFTNAYAHAPATNLTLVALLHGIYPRVSFRPTTSQKPDIELRGLGEQLRARGYATAFFSTAPLNYHRAGEFLAASGDFDLIEDPTQRAPLPDLPAAPWDEMAGSTDEETIASAIRWMDARGAQPFCATIWTNQTHFPYLVAGKSRALADNPDFNRYLNALSEIDQAFGRLMTWLDETGRARDTLVIVLGDHGEAFGQHRNYGHAGHVYEENIHIPLLFIQPGLFRGETYPTVGGIVDLVPTVAEILHLPDDEGWHGRSLFSTQRTGRVYFFAAWSDFLMGYREGDLKKVYNAANDRHIVFDLAADPLETRNLAPRQPAEITREITQRVAAWVQHIEAVYRPLLEDE